MTYNIELPKYKNVAIKLEDNILGYFNIFGNYIEKELDKIRSLDNFVNLEYNEKGYRIKPYIWHILSASKLKEYKDETKLDTVRLVQVVNQVVTNLENDTNFEDFKDKVKDEIVKASYQDESEYADLDINEINIINNIRFIVLIDKPIIENYTDNNRKRTFDIIRMKVYLNTILDEQARKLAVVKHKKDITERVIHKIEELEKFKKFDLSTNYLKLSRLTYIKRPCSLDFVFELKDELKRLEEIN